MATRCRIPRRVGWAASPLPRLAPPFPGIAGTGRVASAAARKERGVDGETNILQRREPRQKRIVLKDNRAFWANPRSCSPAMLIRQRLERAVPLPDR